MPFYESMERIIIGRLLFKCCNFYFLGLKMDIQVVFEVDSIVRTNEGGIQVFPTDGPAPIGVGINTTGRYVIKKGKHLSGDFIYSRTNAYQDKQGRLHGI